jgi:hypothetical protein
MAAYLHFDDMMDGGIPMFTADGRLTSSSAYAPVSTTYPSASSSCALNSMFQSTMSVPSLPYPQKFQGQGVPMLAQEPKKVLPNIRNMKELNRLIGPPDVIDKKNGGIAIWSAATLKKAGYGFLHRLEIIDESVPSVTPVKHFSNVYIWVHLKPSMEQLNNILSLSKDFYYDRKKELLIVRSACLDTAVAQASLILLYTKHKVTFYDLVSNDLLTNYYTGILPGRPACRKVKRALYTILNTAKKMK